ncbi:unnamed protein product [Allacma fusca]|uniref:Uncharacterized protein n=1 Tax=Allacma fusca TaxID=39272 RepID=A0A8J2LCQ2_9HEXA|nr:unnamed protein product [Allacma fusca]
MVGPFEGYGGVRLSNVHREFGVETHVDGLMPPPRHNERRNYFRGTQYGIANAFLRLHNYLSETPISRNSYPKDGDVPDIPLLIPQTTASVQPRQMRCRIDPTHVNHMSHQCQGFRCFTCHSSEPAKAQCPFTNPNM